MQSVDPPCAPGRPRLTETIYQDRWSRERHGLPDVNLARSCSVYRREGVVGDRPQWNVHRHDGEHDELGTGKTGSTRNGVPLHPQGRATQISENRRCPEVNIAAQ